MPSQETPSRAGWLFALPILGSAILLFLVQPLVGKRLLPSYGGAPAVWTLCLAFYQVTLFAGYAYAHGLIRWLPPVAQIGLHAGLFAAAALMLPVLPDESAVLGSGSGATGAILRTLTRSVALPFLFLSATGPLLQAWFARADPRRSPYPLYALSNLGSLTALLAYPTLVEPRLGLADTGSAWSVAFVGVGLAVLGCGGLTARRGSAEPVAAPHASGSESRATASDVALWLLLPGCAVMLLMAVTNELCLDTASVPFLWVLPLAVYLLTFILCFASDRGVPRVPFVLVAALAMVLLSLTRGSAETLTGIRVLLKLPQVVISLYAVLLFSSCMVMHGELHRVRPPARRLTAFYACVSLGGALGGIGVGILAPRWFSSYAETPIALALWCLLVLAVGWRDSAGIAERGASRWHRAATAVALLSVVGYVALGRFQTPGNVLHAERSFFGVLRVVEHEERPPRRELRNGTTLHGLQLLEADHRTRPTAYYGRATAIGHVLAGRAEGPPLRVGVVGLGVGTLAAYGREGDLYRFYEIDPAVVSVARDSGLFTFLAESRADVEVVEADGRLALAAERARAEPGFDVLVVDAFSSDSIPVHLLTREAFALYAERLAEGGVLALHLSNRNLELDRLALRLGAELGLHGAVVVNVALPQQTSTRALWVLLTREPERIAAFRGFVERRRARMRLPPRSVRVDVPAAARLETAPIWTDDYSDLLGVLRLSRRANRF